MVLGFRVERPSSSPVSKKHRGGVFLWRKAVEG